MSPLPRLVLQSDPSKVARLDPATPLTIGRATNNRLALPQETQVSDHHAVVRFSTDKGWLICDWKSESGTFLNGEPLQHCRQLRDGAAIGLGPRGPVLIFQDADPVPTNAAPGQVAGPPPTAAGASSAAPNRGAARPASAVPAARAVRPAPGAPESIDFAGERLALDQILSVTVRSEPHHPQIFSWWLLLCLGSLLLLPFPLLFWLLELGALAGWILLGSRKDHSLVVVLRNGLAYRRSFANRPTALSHRNGIRRALGQGADADGALPTKR
ncbi:MAG: hypothetical protein RLZZ624_224 [Cyanobacteriota bacterium]|jgi:hypothetical protein